MVTLFELMFLLVGFGVGLFFWQLKAISESAERHAHHLCLQRRLQVLSIARIKASIGKVPGKGLGWHTEYQCEFSTDGFNQLNAKLQMVGQRLKNMEIPSYPEPEWAEAPKNRGKFGGCCK